MMNRVIRLIFAMALAGFSTHALVGSAFADDKPTKKEEKADKGDKKKKPEKKDEEKSGW
jgi:hypothetical protein